MLNIHELIDIGTINLSALLMRGSTFFTRSADSPPLIDAARGSKANVDELSSTGEQTISVDTPVGAFEAAYMPWEWRGPDYPTLIYHHGSGERPFDFRRFSSNSFRRLFVTAEEAIPANLIAVRAPFHDGSDMDYVRAMGELENFVGMLAASVALMDALATQAGDQTRGQILASGISLGGWVVNLHRACFGTVDQYVPIFAGAALGEMFVSSIYRKMTARTAQAQPDHLREVLDFEEEFKAVEAANCTPLLARYDRIIEYDRQRQAYEGMLLSVLNNGHVTGSLATDRLREHVLRALSACDVDRIG